MKLYGAIASPYVTRVVMFARLKGIDLELVDAPGGPRSDEYRAINPIAKIPTLVVDGQSIAESEVICEYLEDAFPEPSGLPADIMDRAISRMVSRIIDLYIAPHVSSMVRHVNPEKRDQAVVDTAHEALQAGFGYLEHFMGSGPFAAGDTPTLGDCSAAPYFMLTKKIVFENFDEIADPSEGDGRIATWWQAIQGHDVCLATVDEYATAVDGFLSFLLGQIAKRA
ncbi:MAG: glutathione S-transferase family protein [Gammaproteobacteria bacterium]|jgi:glutathione S-transferase|nr:glutathione S-transferase family protein [Gammaproteobacteria bacterium]MDP6615541.1 glutathione S-transferase family protein [Gammaproteobacteria bacterium]